jgi:hypothetical protein
VAKQVLDSENWNAYGTQAWFYEDWNERVSCRHPIYVTETYTDMDGNLSTRQVYVGDEHAYDVDHHPEKWRLHDNIGRTHSIDKATFEKLAKRWNNRNFKDMKRNYHSIDGDAYYTDYDRVFNHTFPITTKHMYKNKVQASKSVFNFQEVTPEDVKLYGLYEYPNMHKFDYDPLIGHANGKASNLLNWYNAHHGARRQIHMLLVVFEDESRDIAHLQEAYWKGGNKNEFIVCVGKKEDRIDWVKVISWTEQDMLKTVTEREIKEMGAFSASKIAEYMGENVPKKFIRKEFADFDYLTIEPTMTAVIWTTIVTLILTIGICIFVVMNDFDLVTNVRNRFGHQRTRSYTNTNFSYRKKKKGPRRFRR